MSFKRSFYIPNCECITPKRRIKKLPPVPLTQTRFGIDFYDTVDFEESVKRYSGSEIAQSVKLANDNFSLLRTITDFNEGDPGQRVGAAFQPIPDNSMNLRNAAWQEAIRSTNLDVALTIENPRKWLQSVELAVSYIYQFVLPLCKTFTWPVAKQYQPLYYGEAVSNPEVQFHCTKNHPICIVVGLEVGTHLNVGMSKEQFESKADIASNLDVYIGNLLKALKIVGLKIKVTSSFAPSNANMTAAELAKMGIYEFLVQKDGIYSLNTAAYDVDGVKVDFAAVSRALHIIHANDLPNSPGLLLSCYSYWQYQPDVDFPSKSAASWAKTTEERFLAISKPFGSIRSSIGEVGWPSAGLNTKDGSPNKPSMQVLKNLLEGLLLLAKTPSAPNYIFIWQLVDMEDRSSVPKDNPERFYGFYSGGLDEGVLKFPSLQGKFF